MTNDKEDIKHYWELINAAKIIKGKQLMTLKPFNLERALAGDPVVTRDGRKVLEIMKFSSPFLYPVMALVEDKYNSTDSEKFTIEGKLFTEKCSDCDLFMATTKKTYWVNVYKSPFDQLNQQLEVAYMDILHRSKEEAKKSVLNMPPSYSRNYHSTVPIEIEE